MNKLVTVLLFGLSLISNQVLAQTYHEQFNDLFKKSDTARQRQLLTKWEKAGKNDPELFIDYFNYYLSKSKTEVIALGQNPKGKESLKISSQDTTQQEPVGFLYGDTQYDPDLLSKGFNWINRGIENHPNRLDMRFGKTYMYGQLEDYENFTKEIIKTVHYSATNQNKWTWADNKPVDDPKKFMLSTIQSYQLQHYNTENDNLLDNMKRIAESVLEHYPDHVESLSNISIVFMLQKQFDKALVPLLRAEKLNPKDYIVLGNIAQAYKLKGDTANALKYYELTLLHGDEQAKKYAKSQIDKLKKK
ncbi:MAG: tetratricopeptide repeat protein [Cyclobacteriaceae bacterium]|nr:tetratricopeptide repeat protein [Cyclobacteriaceae bacterium]